MENTALRIFYSWQSDTPNCLNRSAIEKALVKALGILASDAELRSAIRDGEVSLDKDTQGVSGSPAITDTILGKIKECAAFVADLTFVGESLASLKKQDQKTRYFSNPNVLLEYGYALRCLGNSKLISVMNTAFGEANPEYLPFDLRHLRWPITYRLESSEDPNKKVELAALAAKLAEALKLILVGAKPKSAVEEKFLPYAGSDDPSIFFSPSDVILPENELRRRIGPVVIPNEGRSWMRLFPIYSTEPLDTEMAARDLASKGGLRPMATELDSWGHARNSHGAIVFETPKDGKLYHLTQLFLTKEIWGLDAFALNSTSCREFTNGRSDGFIASEYVEHMFAETLLNYIRFARDFLFLPLPLMLKTGVAGVENYPIAVKDGHKGSMLHNVVARDVVIDDYATPVHEMLRPFLDYLWAKCGVKRPQKAHETLGDFVSARS